MNNELFYSAKFKKDTVVWYVPIRFFEEENNLPIKCNVLEDVKERDRQVYVFSEEYGHPVYVDRQNLFFKKHSAIKAIQLYSLLYDLYKHDDFEYFMTLDKTLAEFDYPFMAVATYVKLKSGGTGSGWFFTNKEKLDNELIQEFYKRFPDFEKITSIDIMSREKEAGFCKYRNHYNLE